MLTGKLKDELNRQLNIELQASYLYISMAAYLDSKSLNGFAHWMKVQAHEEILHALKFYRYLLDSGSSVEMLPLPQPRTAFKSVLETFELALENEKQLQDKFNQLTALAMGEKDNTTCNFLQWFLSEQVEEIAVCASIVDKLRLIGDNGYGLLMLNNELAARPQATGAEPK